MRLELRGFLREVQRRALLLAWRLLIENVRRVLKNDIRRNAQHMKAAVVDINNASGLQQFDQVRQLSLRYPIGCG